MVMSAQMQGLLLLASRKVCTVNGKEKKYFVNMTGKPLFHERPLPLGCDRLGLNTFIYKGFGR
jgi:hypothetical protein